jgi:hypothetical protein
MQESLQDHDERSSERMKRAPQPSVAERERVMQELIARGFKPWVPEPPKQRRRKSTR